MEHVPLTLGRSLPQRWVISSVDMLQIGLNGQPVLPKDIAVQMLAESSNNHIRLNLFDAECLAGWYLAGLHIGVEDELLLLIGMGVAESVEALVGHANKLGMLLLFLLLGCQFLVVIGPVLLVISGRQRSGINRPVTLGPRSYRKDPGALYPCSASASANALSYSAFDHWPYSTMSRPC